MKRIHWMTLLGVSGAGLAALLLGQAVLGQPDMKVTMPLTPAAAAPEDKGAVRPAVEIYVEDQPPAIPPALPVGPGTSTNPTAPPSKLEPPKAPARVSGPVSLDVQPGRQQAVLAIEWTAPNTIRVNQPMSCQIVVRNTSPTPAQNVIVRHRLAPGVVCKGSEPPATNDGGELVWNLGTLSAEQSKRIDLTLITQTRGPLNCHAVVTFSAVAAHQIQVREPQLAVKMSGPDKVIAGENVTLLFAISNPGDGIAETVKLKTVLPDGLEHPRGKVIEFDVGNLQPKESKVVQLVCAAKTGGVQKCSIQVFGDGGLTANDATQVDILTPRLDIAMSGPKLRYLDRQAVYVVRVTNPGSAPATNVEVMERIPAGFKFHQASNGGQYQEATRLVSWNLGELQPGQSKDVAVNLIPTEIGEHRLTAEAKAARGLKSAADIRTNVEGISSLFLEIGHVDDPIEVGSDTEYEICVRNTGTKLETNVEVICTLPEQLEFKGAKCSTTLRYRQEGRDLIFEPLPRLAPKADVIYRVQVRGIAPGDIRFRTRIKSDNVREPVMREDSTRIYSDEGPSRPAPSAPAAPTAPTTPTVPSSSDPVIIPKGAPIPAPAIPPPAPKTTTPSAPVNSTPSPLPTPAPSSKAPTDAVKPAPVPENSAPLPSVPPVTAPSSKAPVEAPVTLPMATPSVPPAATPSGSTPLPIPSIPPKTAPSGSTPAPTPSVPADLPSIPAPPALPMAPMIPLPAPPMPSNPPLD
jgi:uncharacterized repeat protein (TIGR01451 family)